MSAAPDYLALLDAENEKKCPYPELTKLTKGGFVGFVSSPPRHFQTTFAHQAALDEAAEERAAILEYDGRLSREDAERIARGSHAAYINHVMQQEQTGCGCRTRAWTTSSIVYCAEGQRLKDEYHRAVEAAGQDWREAA